MSADIQDTPSTAVRCDDWLGRVRELQTDAAELGKFVDTLTDAERNGPLRTVNQVVAQAWAISIQMRAVVLNAERPN